MADLAPDTLSVRLDGKGRKIRTCPLWSRTAEVLRALLGPRIDGPREAPIFLNVHGRPITRYGIHGLVVRIANKAAETVPSLRDKRVSPHTVRHYIECVTMSCNPARFWFFRQVSAAMAT